MPQSMRPTWDETWLNVAQVIAQRSTCSRAKIGAVIVDPTNRIVATGYNGPPAGLDKPWRTECDGSDGSGGYCIRGKHGPTDETMFSYSDCPMLHAEANALSFCDRKDRFGGSIYVTGITCINCAKLVANSGLSRLVVIDDPAVEYRVPDDSHAFLEECGVKVIKFDAESLP